MLSSTRARAKYAACLKAEEQTHREECRSLTTVGPINQATCANVANRVKLGKDSMRSQCLLFVSNVFSFEDAWQENGCSFFRLWLFLYYPKVEQRLASVSMMNASCFRQRLTSYQRGVFGAGAVVKRMWVWLKIQQEGQTAGFGPCVHLPGSPFGTGFLSHSHVRPRTSSEASAAKLTPSRGQLSPSGHGRGEHRGRRLTCPKRIDLLTFSWLLLGNISHVCLLWFHG